jgi:putative sigma-54 modulation protein
MNIQITARHGKASQTLQDTLTSDLQRLERFSDKITSCHAILDNEHSEKLAEVIVNVQGTTVNAKARAETIGKAADMVMEKIERQLKKFNDKLKNHKAVPIKSAEAPPEPTL